MREIQAYRKLKEINPKFFIDFKVPKWLELPTEISELNERSKESSSLTEEQEQLILINSLREDAFQKEIQLKHSNESSYLSYLQLDQDAVKYEVDNKDLLQENINNQTTDLNIKQEECNVKSELKERNTLDFCIDYNYQDDIKHESLTNQIKCMNEINNNDMIENFKVQSNENFEEKNLSSSQQTSEHRLTPQLNSKNINKFTCNNINSNRLSCNVMSNHRKLNLSNFSKSSAEIQLENGNSDSKEFINDSITDIDFLNSELNNDSGEILKSSDINQADLLSLIKEEMIEQEQYEKNKKLDHDLVSKAEKLVLETQKSKADSIFNNFIPNPIHLSYNQFIIKKSLKSDSSRQCKKRQIKYEYFLGIEKELNTIVITPDFEDYIQCIFIIKDRFSLENHIQKLSTKRGFKLIAINDKGVTKRDFKCFRSEGTSNSTNCPFELRYKKLITERNDNENRYYLAYFRSIHNHPLELDTTNEITNNDKDSYILYEDISWFLQNDTDNYYKMISKIYRKEVSYLPNNFSFKKRELKSFSKENENRIDRSDRDSRNQDEFEAKIYESIKRCNQAYIKSLDEYLKEEYKLTVTYDLINKCNSDNFIKDYSEYKFDGGLTIISLPTDEKYDGNVHTIEIDQQNTNSFEIEISNQAENLEKNKFFENIDKDQTDDYSLS